MKPWMKPWTYAVAFVETTVMRVPIEREISHQTNDSHTHTPFRRRPRASERMLAHFRGAEAVHAWSFRDPCGAALLSRKPPIG